MQTPLVLTVIGQDRPGLVEKVARAIARHGGNWLESRMCRLGGQFAGIVRLEVSPAQQADLTSALGVLEASGLTVRIHPGTPEAAGALPGTPAQLELVGQDRPGIVQQIAAALASQNVNVEDLATECVSAAMSGEPLFKARARLLLPPGCNPANLQLELERVANDLLVDLTFAPLPGPAANTPGL